MTVVEPVGPILGHGKKSWSRQKIMGESPSMSLVYKEGVWRVRIAWPKRQRYFGRFASKAEAQRWLSGHQRMIHPTVEAEKESAK